MHLFLSELSCCAIITIRSLLIFSFFYLLASYMGIGVQTLLDQAERAEESFNKQKLHPFNYFSVHENCLLVIRASSFGTFPIWIHVP